MKKLIRTAAIVLMSMLGAVPAMAQQHPMKMSKGPATLRSTLEFQLTIEEHEFVGLADAMPADKYNFAPTNGDFTGVRTFAQQVKHVATANDRFFGAILGKAPATPGDRFEQENGPDSIKTKAQIMQYLRDSFAEAHKAINSITAENAFQPVSKAPIPFLQTRAALAIFACVHMNDHYGQMVEYLRDNGLVPPASRNRPLANPPTPHSGK